MTILDYFLISISIFLICCIVSLAIRWKKNQREYLNERYVYVQKAAKHAIPSGAIPMYHVSPICGEIAFYTTTRLVSTTDEFRAEYVIKTDGTHPVDFVEEVACCACGVGLCGSELSYEIPKGGAA